MSVQIHQRHNLRKSLGFDSLELTHSEGKQQYRDIFFSQEVGQIWVATMGHFSVAISKVPIKQNRKKEYTMNTSRLFDIKTRNKAILAFVILFVITIAAVVTASLTQRDFGRIDVSNVRYSNYNGISIRAKLLHPVGVTSENPAPGIVYVHGYQNNRGTSDPYCIELARRGFVVLNIDAIGRGNSGNPGDISDPEFDITYGTCSSLKYLRALPYVNVSNTGLMGHSLGAEMCYTAALKDPDLKAIAFSGFGYTGEATLDNPKNMLMILGKWDEYRTRMTNTKDYESEWMTSERTRKVIDHPDPQFDATYGNFADGTARRVFMPHTTHVRESFSREAIAEALEWMRQALKPDTRYWISSDKQIWPVKEWACFIAMLACFASILPLGLILLGTGFFKPLQATGMKRTYTCSNKNYFKFAGINGVLMFFYLPIVLILFGFHIYVVRIDKVFPMMMVNGIVFWFVIINLIGFFIFKSWFKKGASKDNLTMTDLGISSDEKRFRFNRTKEGKSILLGILLFAYACVLEHILEAIFIVDFRFIFPFASNFTPYRFLMFLEYSPFLLIGFIQMGILLHGQMRQPEKNTLMRTFANDLLYNLSAMLVPLFILLAIQYIPLFTRGFIPFVGPGAALVGFVINLTHIIIVLVMAISISTWFYRLTGNIYTAAILNALLVAWMFTSSSVIAPVPVNI